MTSYIPQQSGNGGGATITAPELVSLPSVDGGTNSVWHDVYRAGLDPAAAFGAAFAGHKILNNERVNNALDRVAHPSSSAPAAVTADSPRPTLTGFDSRTEAEALNDIARDHGLTPASEAKPQTSLDGSAGSPMDDKTTVSSPKASADATPPKASSAADNAVKAADRSFTRAFTESGAKGVVREGTVLAAKRGAALGAKVAATTLLRIGALSTPGVGTAITVALWMIDTDSRKAFNNLVSSVFGPGAAPELNAAPSPPRTEFLPLTNDGNRDGIIEDKDKGMVRTNNAAFRFDPKDVWPVQNPNIATTSDFSAVADKVNAFNARLTRVIEELTAAYQSQPDEDYVAAVWANSKPGVTALADFQSTMLPTIGAQLMAGANSANNAYQAFRDVNLKNRQEINNSTSGMIPFWRNHVNADNMSDSTAELKSALDDMERIARTLGASADAFNIAPNNTGRPSTTAGGQPQTRQEPVNPTPAAPVLPAPTTPLAPPAAPKPAENPAKDLASLLRNAMPGGGMPMPSAPPIPQIPIPGSGMPQNPGLNTAAKPPNLNDKPIDPLKKALDDVKKPGEEDTKKKPPLNEHGRPEVTPPYAPAPGTPAKAVEAGNPNPGPAAPAASNTVKAGGRDWHLDNPKLAAMVNALNDNGAGHKSVQQAASEAGFKLPPPGQDIGVPKSINEIKPGDVIMGANNRNGVFLGMEGDQAMAINEEREVVPLDKVLITDGPHQGIFRLTDDGTAPAGATPVQSATSTSPTSPPASPLGTPQAVNPDVLPGQTTGPQTMNPGTVPPNN